MEKKHIQSVLGDDGSPVIKDRKTAKGLKKDAETRSILEYRKSLKAVCPWCLYQGSLYEFTQVKNGEIQKMVECPECHEEMRAETTRKFDELGPYDYSQWVWENVFMWHGFQKFKWEILKSRIRGMGFANIFWDAWRRMKDKSGASAPQQGGREIDFNKSKEAYFASKRKKKLGEAGPEAG